MKRLLSGIVFTLLIFCFSVYAFADWELVGSGSQPGTERMWRQYTCTADASNGSFPVLTVVGFQDYHLFTIETWPGDPSPTDATDFTLIDDATIGEDLLGGTGTDAIDATTKKTLIPYSSTMDLFYTPLIKGDITITVTNNSVNSAIINIRLTGER